MHVKHKKVWGFVGLPLESPRSLSHIGVAARKAAEGGSGAFPSKPWEIGDFGLLQSVMRVVLTGGRASAPRALFCVLKVWRTDSGLLAA
jgi:hypothetical protein